MISDNVMVLNYRIGVWGAEKTDRQISNEVCESHQAEPEAGKFVKNLLGGKCDELKAIKNAAQNARMTINKITLPYRDGSVMIPNTLLIETLQKISELENQFNSLVSEFVEMYPDIIERARTRTNNLFDPSQCPSQEQVRSKFTFDYSLEPLPQRNNFDSILGVEDMVERLKSDLDRRLNSVMEQATTELKNRLLERLVITSQSIHSQKINRRIPKTNSEIVGLCRRLNITQNTDVISLCDALDEVGNRWEIIKVDLASQNDAVFNLNTLINQLGSINVANQTSIPQGQAGQLAGDLTS